MLLANTPNTPPANIFANLFQPSQYAFHQFQRAVSAVGYQGPTILLFGSYSVDNALAITQPIFQPTYPLTFSHNQRHVIYNPTFMTNIEFWSGNEFAPLSIFAHEVGHHLYGHTDTTTEWYLAKHSWQKETEADYCSGLALARLGAKPKDLESAHRLIFSMWASSTHPDSFNRISSIAKGWKDGGGIGIVEDNLQHIYNKIINELSRWSPPANLTLLPAAII